MRKIFKKKTKRYYADYKYNYDFMINYLILRF